MDALANVAVMQPPEPQFERAQRQRIRSQMHQLQRMARMAGHSLDPKRAEDAAAYFRAFAVGRTTEEVREEYQRFLRTFFQHSCTASCCGVAGDLHLRPTDHPGLRSIDCHELARFGRTIFQSVEDELGDRRFGIIQGAMGERVMSAVIDRVTGRGFVVERGQVSEVMPGLEAAKRALAAES
jgi:hypothetical protein